MPFGDGTGPNGFGPLTGKGLGRCGQNSNQEKIYRDGRGFGRGLRRGFRFLKNRFLRRNSQNYKNRRRFF